MVIYALQSIERRSESLSQLLIKTSQDILFAAKNQLKLIVSEVSNRLVVIQAMLCQNETAMAKSPFQHLEDCQGIWIASHRTWSFGKLAVPSQKE